MRYVMFLLAVLSLGACAKEVVWNKPGVTAAQLEKDKESCTQEVPRAGAAGGGATPTTYRVRQLQPRCMEGLGYTRSVE